MHRRWLLRECDAEARELLPRASGVSALVGRVLAARGFMDPNAVAAFLNPSLASLPDPESIPGMAAAVGRLAAAVRSAETAWVYTDYDVDGVTSAALLSQFFAETGLGCSVYLPRRDREGYGLHPQALREIADQGGRLVVTADCGVSAVEPARVARELGIDLIITDHHMPGPELPEAVAVVNPKLPGSGYPDSMLAGVGVAWNLAAALRRYLRQEGYFAGREEPDVKALLDLVALGTVADVAPLREVNRVLVSFGLRQLNRRPRPGIEALREVAGVRGELRAGHIGFQLGPRLNAAGRLDGPHEALGLLAAESAADARETAEILDGLNRRRQAEERTILGGAAARVEGEGWWPGRWSLVVEAEGWHPGVIGIVASRLAERYHRPTVVLSVEGGTAKGSARSVPGLNLVETLADCSDLLRRFGGHAAAAGLEVATEQVEELRGRFEAAVRSRLQEADLVPVLVLDAEVAFGECSLEAVRGMARLEPFGVGNPTPLFLTRGARVLDVRPIGRGGDHLKFRLEHEGVRRDALAWRKAEGLSHVQPGMQVDVAHSVQVSAWNGRENVQLVVEGMRPSG